MADDLMTVGDECGQRFRVSLQRLHHAKHAALDVEFPENPQDSPDTGARSIFEGGLDDRAALAGITREPGVRQHALRRAVAVHDGALATGLEIQVDIDRDARIAGPLRVRRLAAVAAKIPCWTSHVVILRSLLSTLFPSTCRAKFCAAPAQSVARILRG